MHIRIILEFFEKYQCSGIAFLLQSSKYVSNEYSCLKTTGLYDYLLLLSSLFHFFISYSVLPFHLVYVLQFLHLFFYVLSQAFIKHSKKAFVYICIACIIEYGASLIAQLIKNLPAMRETLVRFLGQENPLEKG